MQLKELPVARIDLPHDAHRIDIDPASIDELAESIRQHGLLNPITARPMGKHRWEIVAGHRRFLACLRLGWHEIPANVIDGRPLDLNLTRFAENMERANLSPMEEAIVLLRTLESVDGDIATLARKANRSIEWVKHRLELVDYDDELKECLHQGFVPIAVAHEIARIGSPEYRSTILKWCINNGASVATVRSWRRSWECDAARTEAAMASKDAKPPSDPYAPPKVNCRGCNYIIDPDEVVALVFCVRCAHEFAKLQGKHVTLTCQHCAQPLHVRCPADPSRSCEPAIDLAAHA